MSLDPSLALIPSAYKAGKLYSVLPEDGTGDFTVSRNGTATYFDKDGLLKTAQPNEPRLEFDPLTGEFKGVLVEPSVTNAVIDSQVLIDTWSTTRVIKTINDTISPDGSENATLHTVSAIGNVSRTSSALDLDITPTTDVTVSVFLKNKDLISSGFEICVNCRGVSGNNLASEPKFDHTDRFVFLVGGTGRYHSQKITELPNGWYRISVFYRFPENVNRINTVYFDLVNNLNESEDGLNTGLWIYGVQANEGHIEHSYIPTSGSQVTRPADIITRTNVADLIGQEEFSILVNANITKNNFDSVFIQCDNKSTSFRLAIETRSNNTYRISFANQNTPFTLISSNSPISIGENKLAVVFTNQVFKFFVNGFLIGNLNINSSNEDYTNISLGSGLNPNSLSRFINDHIKSAYIFKRALTDAEAISLTTL